MRARRQGARRPKVISLFSGAGGLDLGFSAAGFDIAGCVELEQWACDTLRANHPSLPVWGPPIASGNVHDLSAQELLDFVNLRPGEVDVVIGGPPCQPFSAAANQRFLKGDSRFKRQGFSDASKGMLLFEYLRMVRDLAPTVFLLENVPGLLTIDSGEQLGLAMEELSRLGYHISERKITRAVDYGVPQYRERLIIWGTRKPIGATCPPGTHGPSEGLFKPSHTVVSQALTGILPTIPNHVVRNHADSSVQRYRTLEFGQREKLGRVDRLDPRKPSKTVIAGGMRGGGRSHLHPFVARTLTVREGARLQTFPDSYVFHGTISRQFTQVGNAVPPLLAEHFARHIATSVFGIDSSGMPLVFKRILNVADPIEVLVDRLFKEAVSENAEAIYLSHCHRGKKRVSAI